MGFVVEEGVSKGILTTENVKNGGLFFNIHDQLCQKIDEYNHFLIASSVGNLIGEVRGSSPNTVVNKILNISKLKWVD